MKRRVLLATNIAGLILTLLIGITGAVNYSAFIQYLQESVSASAASVGVIGEADGPTAIFVSGNFNLTTTALIVLASLILVAIFFFLNIVYFIRNKKKCSD